MALTDLDFLTPGASWPPDGESARLEAYVANRLLFDGKHDQVFESWIKTLRQTKDADPRKAFALEIILNFPKRLSTLWADFLLGEAVKVVSGEPEGPAMKALEKLMDEDNNFRKALYEGVIDFSRFGDMIIKVGFDGTKVTVGTMTPDFWFPVVSPDDVKTITQHVLAWKFTGTAPGDHGKREYLKVQIHEPGFLTTRVFRMNGPTELGKEVGLPWVEETGVDRMLVFHAGQLTTSETVTGRSDYGDIESVLMEIETRLAQVATILNKHADPSMSGPMSALEMDPDTRTWKFKHGSFIPSLPGEPEAKYLTWDGRLEASFDELDRLLQWLFILSETSATVFGDQKNGNAESGSALKRLLMAPLAKVNRMKMYLDPVVKDVLRTAMELGVAKGVDGLVALDDLRIEWNDGLPDDEAEIINNEVTKYGAGLTSRRSAIRRMEGLEGKELEDELQAIDDEKAKERENAPEPPAVNGSKVDAMVDAMNKNNQDAGKDGGGK